jgi:hypothetical protein
VATRRQAHAGTEQRSLTVDQPKLDRNAAPAATSDVPTPRLDTPSAAPAPIPPVPPAAPVRPAAAPAQVVPTTIRAVDSPHINPDIGAGRPATAVSAKIASSPKMGLTPDLPTRAPAPARSRPATQPAPTVLPNTTPTRTLVTQPMRRTSSSPRPTTSSTLRTVTPAKRSNPQVDVLPKASQAFSGDAAASVTPDTKPPTQTPRIPAQLPILVGQNARPSGDTAGTGGIRQISANLGSDRSLSVRIDGDLKRSVPRSTAPNFNRTLPSGREIGLTDYEIAHAWGPGFGDEARDGMMYAPRDVNQVLQNRAIESRLRDLFRLADQQGATIRVRVQVTSHPLTTWRGHHLLKDASYHFEVSLPNGKTVPIGEVDIHVPPPTSSGTASGMPTVNVRGGSQGIWSLQ